MKKMTDNICTRCNKGIMQFRKFCGVDVCNKCGYHQGLGKCYCGWPKGEKLEDDDSSWDEETSACEKLAVPF